MAGTRNQTVDLNMKALKMFPALMVAALLHDATRSLGLSLPVYQVVQSGATAAQAADLSAALGTSPGPLPLANGLLSFVDTNSYLRVPATPVTDATVTNELLAVSKNPVPSLPLVFNALDFTALSQITVLDANAALNIASNALESSALYPANAVPVAGNDWFTAFYTNDFGQVISNCVPLNTRVHWRLSTPNGYPLVGPGAQVQVTFEPGGSVSRLLYSARQLQAGPMVDIISPDVASNRFAQIFPANAQFTLQLVYWSPPLRPLPSSSLASPPPAWNPTNIIPWYEASGSLARIDPVTGGQETVPLRTQIIPATDDTRFVPTVSLNASGSTLISARATVSGGQPPYTFIWAGSDPSASTNGGDSITYTPRVRAPFPPLTIAFNPAAATLAVSWPDPSPGFVLQSAADLQGAAWVPVTNSVTTSNGTNIIVIPALSRQLFRLVLSNGLPRVDAVTVTVRDANGTGATATADIPVIPQAIPSKLKGPLTYGCESPNDPGLYQEARVYWETIMGRPDVSAGVEGFCWLEYNSWPGDFVIPSPPGSLPAKPWIYGDADFANWGVDTANIVLYNGDGSYLSFFAEMDPVSTPDNYPASYLHNPFSGREDFFFYEPGSYVVNYDGAWSSIGPNHNLDWLCFYACSMMTNVPTGPHPWGSWGPAFDGLHIMTGFFTPASALAIGLCADFPGGMLGVLDNNPPLTIVEAWVDAAISDDAGIPAAMGPVGPNGVLDFMDYYWGKGPVGPSIPTGLIKGWWYIAPDQPVLFN